MLSKVHTSTPKKLVDYLATYGLWLATAILAVYEINLVREIVDSIYGRWLSSTDRSSQVRTAFAATALGQGITIVMAILAIAIVIGGFEYHCKRVGETRSLRILAGTLAVQIFILAFGLVL
jgi:hypothetical protein